MPRIPDVGRSVLPEVFGRVGRFVCRDDVDVQILVLVEVGQGMDVEVRRFGFAGQFAETMGELFLEFVREIDLGAEKDYTAARYCPTLVCLVVLPLQARTYW